MHSSWSYTYDYGILFPLRERSMMKTIYVAHFSEITLASLASKQLVLFHNAIRKQTYPIPSCLHNSPTETSGILDLGTINLAQAQDRRIIHLHARTISLYKQQNIIADYTV